MANMLYYRLLRRGIEVTSEVVCPRHYAEMAQPGGCMEPLSVREQRAGREQTVTPYRGDRPCASCEEEADQRGAA